jgi:hypothetical protein
VATAGPNSTPIPTYDKLLFSTDNGDRFVTDSLDPNLIPRPQHMTVGGEHVAWPASHGEWLDQALALGGALTCSLEGPALSVQVDSGAFESSECYALDVQEDGIQLRAGGAAGRYYGLRTLAQLARGNDSLPAVNIEDWPDFQARGVLLDISRDKVPTMATLEAIVEELAGWKINQLQLYMEHTFAYAGHETVWENASPLTAQEVRQLDALCRRHHMELVPNQNSFGHMHRWLRHDAYRHLAEVPEGIEHAFSSHKEPFGLCPTDPGSLALLEDLYDQLLPCFTSRRFNVGLDETIDLGKGRSATLCEEQGTGRVYVDFVKQIAQRVASRGFSMQMWADIVMQHADLVGELPEDVTLLLWGYEADHPFEEQCQQVAAAGKPFYVCPGTSAWNAIAGRTTNMIGNLVNAAQAGRAHGAVGYLNTDWGDNGHLQPLSVSKPGWMLGAACAWNGQAMEDLEPEGLARLLDEHVFLDRAGQVGSVVTTLGDAYDQLGWTRRNQSEIFNLLLYPERNRERLFAEGVTEEALTQTRATVEEALARLDGAQIARDDAELVRGELAWVGEALLLGLDMGLQGLEPSLADRYRALATRRRALWLWRNRPGGLNDSVARLERVADLLASTPSA